MKIYIVILCIGLQFTSLAQSFLDVTSLLGVSIINGGSNYGSGVSFFDFNEDGWDDLTICVPGSPTRLYKNVNGLFQLVQIFPNMGQAKQPIWFDFDNDGYNDLLIVRNDNTTQLFKNQNNNLFSDESAILNLPFVNTPNFWNGYGPSGGAIGDPNRDGFLDISVANYGFSSGTKNFFRWNRDGNYFEQDSSEIFCQFNRHSFQSVWVDVDADGFQELFVINDFHEGNEYYKIDSSFEYIESSADYGLNFPTNAMSNSWCDFDSDGDFDLFVTDIDSVEMAANSSIPWNGSALLVNEGGIFVNRAEENNCKLNKWCWGAMWIDVLNDGFSDLIVIENHEIIPNSNVIYISNSEGDLNSEILTEFDNLNFSYYTSAKGDIDNDGRYDVYLMPETNNPSKLFKNQSSTLNNFIRFRLSGRIGNRNGFGSTYRVYAGGICRTGQLLSTENYLTQNSQNIIVGMGENETIDSLCVFWLSGVTDWYYNLPVNQTLVLTEAETKSGIVSERNYLCSNADDSLSLKLPNWEQVIWNDGFVGNERWVYEPGVYSVDVNMGFGSFISYSIEINSAMNTDVIEEIISPVTCWGWADGSYELLINGDVVVSENNISSGTYEVHFVLPNGCPIAREYAIQEPEELTLIMEESIFICRDSCVLLNPFAQGGTPPYIYDTDTESVFFCAGAYELQVTDDRGCADIASFEILEYAPPVLNVIIEPQLFDSYGSITVDSIGFSGLTWYNGTDDWIITNLVEGNYGVQVVDNFHCLLDTVFYVPMILNTVDIHMNSQLLIENDRIINQGNIIMNDVVIINSLGQCIASIRQLNPRESCLFPKGNAMTTGIYFLKSSIGNYKFLYAKQN